MSTDATVPPAEHIWDNAQDMYDGYNAYDGYDGHEGYEGYEGYDGNEGHDENTDQRQGWDGAEEYGATWTAGSDVYAGVDDDQGANDWVEMQDEDGNTYFANSLGDTQWERPPADDTAANIQMQDTQDWGAGRLEGHMMFRRAVSLMCTRVYLPSQETRSTSRAAAK